MEWHFTRRLVGNPINKDSDHRHLCYRSGFKTGGRRKRVVQYLRRAGHTDGVVCRHFLHSVVNAVMHNDVSHVAAPDQTIYSVFFRRRKQQ